MKRKHIYIAAALSMAVLGSIAAFGGDSDAASEGFSVDVARVSRGTIESTVTAQGEVFLLDNDFAFVNNVLEVSEVLVREHDVVEIGQPLIRFNSDTRDRDRERERLETQLRDAQLSLRSAEVSLDNTRIPPTQTELENARLTVTRAEQGISDAEFALTQIDLNIDQQRRLIEQQERNIEQQRRNIEHLGRVHQQAERASEQSERSLEQFERGIEQRERMVEQLERGMDQLHRNLEQAERNIEQLERVVELRETVLEDALTSLSNTQTLFGVGAATQNQLDSVERSVENAQNDVINSQNDVVNARNGRQNALDAIRNAENDIINARADIRNAEGDFISVQDGVATSEDNIRNAEDNIRNAEANIENAKSDIIGVESNITALQLQRTQAVQNISASHDNLRFARIQYDEIQNRLNTPQTMNSIAQQEINIDRIRLSIEQIQSDIDNLEDVEEYLLSPISGTITAINAVRGETVAPGRGLIQISDAEEYILRAFVNERHAGQLGMGQEVLVEGSILGDEVLNGTITSVGTVAQANQVSGVVERVVPVEIRVDQEAQARNLLMPGVTLDITIITDVRENVIAIPILSVITQRDGSNHVFVMDSNNTIQQVEVELGAYADMTIEATGISEGDVIVLQPTSTMEGGMVVTPASID